MCALQLRRVRIAQRLAGQNFLSLNGVELPADVICLLGAIGQYGRSDGQAGYALLIVARRERFGTGFRFSTVTRLIIALPRRHSSPCGAASSALAAQSRRSDWLFEPALRATFRCSNSISVLIGHEIAPQRMAPQGIKIQPARQ
jgi:hypothetical protein